MKLSYLKREKQETSKKEDNSRGQTGKQTKISKGVGWGHYRKAVPIKEDAKDSLKFQELCKTKQPKLI